jgi:hypothetical protein
VVGVINNAPSSKLFKFCVLFPIIVGIAPSLAYHTDIAFVSPNIGNMQLKLMDAKFDEIVFSLDPHKILVVSFIC